MYIKNTATNGNNLLDKLKANLVANNWELLVDRVQTTRELYFRNTNSLVIIGMKVVTDNLTYFNLILNTILTFNSANSFYNQTGTISTSSTSQTAFPVMGLSLVIPMTYHAFINDNRLILVANISSIYNMCYIGKFDAVINPAQYQNPVFVGGHLNEKSYLISNVSDNNTVFMLNSSGSNNKIRLQDDSFSNVYTLEFSGRNCFYPMFSGLQSSGVSDSSYYKTNEIERLLIFGVNEPLGYIDGVYRVFGSNFSALSTFNIDGEDYILFPNIFRQSDETYYAIKKV